MPHPAFHAVNPSDSEALPKPCFTFYVGSPGDVAVLGHSKYRGTDKTPTVFRGVPAGWFSFPERVAQIMFTGTTASEIIAHLPPSDG